MASIEHIVITGETVVRPKTQEPAETPSRGDQAAPLQNVGNGERMVSLASGAVLTLLGLGRRDSLGALIAGVGGALVFRGASGHCPAYGMMGMNTADSGTSRQRRGAKAAREDIHVSESMLIDKSPEELYAYWRNLENLPVIMTHLESVRATEGKRSHWVATAPRIAGGKVEWDAEITVDEPNHRIAWRSLPGADVEHYGSVRFVRAPGDRGTAVRVVLNYRPPAGQLGRWLAKLWGEAPEQQIREDLRRFKQRMEIGEAPTVEGQPHGTCLGWGYRSG